MAGLASLTANYTDSEDEDRTDEPVEPWAAAVVPATLADRLKEKSGVTPTDSRGGSNPASAKSTPTKKTRLVSYVEEGAEDDRDDSSDDGATVPMELDSDNDGKAGSVDEGGAKEEEESRTAEDEEAAAAADREAAAQNAIRVEAWTGGVQLPPEPQGLCDRALQERITNLYKRKLETKFDMNDTIQGKKGFRNPSIYEKLIQFCDIDETGTNFPKELYDGHLFGKESYYDELSRVQALDMERREKAAKNRRPVEMPVPVLVAARKTEDLPSAAAALAKRKSKWDQAAPAPLASSRPPTNPNLPPPNVPAPQVVSAGAKTISAFGPLKK